MFKKIIFVLVGFFILNFALAQGGGFPVTPPPVGAPIDGGLSLLLAAGAAYGAKKVYDFRNKE
jgi:hypothetical protein